MVGTRACLRHFLSRPPAVSSQNRLTSAFSPASGSAILQATPCASVPGPGSGSNGTDPSTAGVGAQPSTCAGDRFEFDPLPQRAKRSRPRATLSETDGTPAQRRGTAGDGEGGTTLAIPTSGSSECTASPQENNDASPRDSNVSLSAHVGVVGVRVGGRVLWRLTAYARVSKRQYSRSVPS